MRSLGLLRPVDVPRARSPATSLHSSRCAVVFPFPSKQQHTQAGGTSSVSCLLLTCPCSHSLQRWQANNYKIVDAAETIVFEGTQAPLAGRAAFLTACTFVCLASLALVLTIFEQQAFGGGLGNIWYAATLASPVAGKYYLDNAERTDQISVKIITEDDEMSADIIVQGDDEEVERFQKTLDLREKGMIYVKGILES